MAVPERRDSIYLGLAVGVLALGILVLGVLRLAELPQAWAACRGWGIMIPLVFGGAVSGAGCNGGLFAAVGMVGFLELGGAGGMLGNRLLVGVVLVGIVLMGVAELQTAYLPVVPPMVLVAILLVPVVQNEPWACCERWGWRRLGSFGWEGYWDLFP